MSGERKTTEYQDNLSLGQDPNFQLSKQDSCTYFIWKTGLADKL